MKKLSSQGYSDAVEGLDALGNIVCNLLRELLSDAEIQIHSVTHRVKDHQSTVKKMSINSDRYSSVGDLTDLLGIRIITYFPDDVDRVARILRKEFKIDDINSIDKRTSLEPDQFGYLSLHFVATLHNKRARLIEYKRYTDKAFEVQIRSILQHAWAEIEHDLGYKVNSVLPADLRRRFSLLAGLLESADEEFKRVRNEITIYEKHVTETIGSAPQALEIDQSTVVAALESEKVLIDLDSTVAEAAGRQLEDNINTDFAAREAIELRNLGLKNIQQILDFAITRHEHIRLFTEHWSKRDDKSPATDSKVPFNRGIGLFYLGYTLAAQKKSADLTLWGKLIFGRNDDLLPQVRKTWQQVIRTLGEPKDKN